MSESVLNQPRACGASGAIRVRAPARLHLGFIDLNGELGRRFGSIGLAIDGCDAVVTARLAAHPSVQGVAGARAQGVIETLRQSFGDIPPLSIRIEHAPPAHAGLGSGTQLALAVASACMQVLGRPYSPRELAPYMGRGERSGIGIAAFEGGGFVVDGGRGRDTRIAPLLTRLEFPAAWHALLIFDEVDEGLSGSREQAVFNTLAPMSAVVAGELARWCLVRMLPAVAEHDFENFSEAVAEVQQRVGHYFAEAQGGSIYTSGKVARVIAALQVEFGAQGVGQSSWGPTGFVFAPTAALAHTMREFGEREFATHLGLRLRVVAAANRGARIDQIADTLGTTREST